MTIEDDVAQHLASLVPALTYGQNCLTGPVRQATAVQSVPGAVPEEVVFTLAVGGLTDIPFIDGGAKTSEQRPSVLLTVRSAVNDYDGGRALAESVFSALDKDPPSGYFEARCFGAQPNYLGKDDTEHHEWTITLNLMKC